MTQTIVHLTTALDQPHNTWKYQPRLGEGQAPRFRTSRFFCVGNHWYFTTREGFDSGPYATRERAESGLQRFIRVARLLPRKRLH
ncbi:MAG: DUF6316 family protein [Oleiphilaceae bacterium]|nr:DUF6316 family protein [Oleiphilaceae bacterium]